MRKGGYRNLKIPVCEGTGRAGIREKNIERRKIADFI